MVFFSAASCKKRHHFGAARKFFSSSYLVTTLPTGYKLLETVDGRWVSKAINSFCFISNDFSTNLLLKQNSNGLQSLLSKN